MSNYQDILDKLQEKAPRNSNDHVLLVDGMNTLIRSFTTVRAMNPVGNHIGGTTGFLRSIGYLNRIIRPTKLICVFEGKGSSQNRKNVDSNYKATRGIARITNWGMFDSKIEEDESLSFQLERLFNYLDCLPVPYIFLEKLEADDIIGYISEKLSSEGKKVTIVSSDRDFLQLVNSNVEIYSPIKRKFITQENIKTILGGIIPENYNIVKALTGDNSDNLVGIKGVGTKTLLKSFPELGTNPNLKLDNIYEISKKSMDKKLVFSRIIDDWNKVITNFELMDLHETSLDENEVETVNKFINDPVPSLNTGAFLRLLEIDKIEGIVKNTVGWLQEFQSLVR